MDLNRVTDTYYYDTTSMDGHYLPTYSRYLIDKTQETGRGALKLIPRVGLSSFT